VQNFVTDHFDDAILALVQHDNQMSHAAIGARVNLSASAVRRRLKAMRNNGIIVADVALVDPARKGLSFVVQVYFEREDPQATAAFIAQMQAEPRVSQCYSVSGECDFWLMVHAQTPEAFESWGQATLMANPKIRRYSTSLVWSRQVFRTSISTM
jgi:Lrp/AsnC family transcriptional regulator, leucine-responsive regulatory protein